MKQRTNLRVDTSETNPPFESAFSSNAFSSIDAGVDGAGANGDEERGHNLDDEESRTMIRRSFAFDEWDDCCDGTTASNDEMEDTDSQYNSSEVLKEFRKVEEAIEDIDQKLQRIIHRKSFFDAMDDEELAMFACQTDHERDNNILTSDPYTSFIPIESGDRNCNDPNGDETKTTPTKTKPSYTRTLFASPSLPSTMFHLDTPRHTAAVTPSPEWNRIRHPFPLYSHEVVQPTASFSVDMSFWWRDSTNGRVRTTTTTTTDNTSNTNNHNNRQNPKDYKSLDRMMEGIRPDPSFENLWSPPRCDSIPRRASAFRKVGNGGTDEPFAARQQQQQQQQLQQQQHPQQEWFDHLAGMDAKPFEEDEEVFESPTISYYSEDSMASTVPEFIICHKNE